MSDSKLDCVHFVSSVCSIKTGVDSITYVTWYLPCR